MNILIYPCGTEIGLELERAFRYQKDINIFGANTFEDHSRFYFKDIAYIPGIYEDPEGAIESIKSLIKGLDIDFFFPAHDQVIIESLDIPQAIVPERITAEICRSKRRTYKFFDGIIPVPKMFSTNISSFPVFCKPDCGQGTRGTFVVKNRDELKKVRHELILEYLPGEEFTIDCFTDRHGRLRYCQPRLRARINGGISVRTIIANEPLRDMAEWINSNLSLRGQWFFQTKKNASGDHVLMEIAPRAAGSSCLARARGVNLPLLTLWDRLGKEVEIIENDIQFVDRALESKFVFEDFENVYVDLDDTLIPVKWDLMGLLYKLKGKGKRLFIVTRNKGDIAHILSVNCIDQRLFNYIYQIYQTDDKNSVIADGSILIDDSFRERKSVRCTAFDVWQAIEVL
jgi:hypothetical protein